MSVFASPRFLRNVLIADALSCLGCGALQLVFPAALSSLLGLAPGLLLSTGVFLVVYAAVVAFIATRQPVPRAVVWLLVFGNLGWALLCGALLLGGQAQPTTLGTAYVLMQAVTVALLAELQWFGLRHAPMARLSAA